MYEPLEDFLAAHLCLGRYTLRKRMLLSQAYSYPPFPAFSLVAFKELEFMTPRGHVSNIYFYLREEFDGTGGLLEGPWP
jgi:hypothetical protein